MTKKKILLLALGWVLASGTGARWRQRKAWQELCHAVERYRLQEVKRSIESLYASGLIVYHDHSDGTLTLTLTKQGKIIALRYNLDRMTIPKPERWDKKWRMVAFDIPETFKGAREALRERLRALGFFKYHKSIFVHPYPCENEIEYIREFYGIKQYVRFGCLESIDDDLALRQHFAGLLR